MSPLWVFLLLANDSIIMSPLPGCFINNFSRCSVFPIWEKEGRRWILSNNMTLQAIQGSIQDNAQIKRNNQTVYLDAYTNCRDSIAEEIIGQECTGSIATGPQSIISSQQSVMQSMAHSLTRISPLQNVWQDTEVDLLTGFKEVLEQMRFMLNA